MISCIDVETDVLDDGKIVQQVFASTSEVRERIMLEVIDTKEHQVSQALISLGWMPPPNA